MTKNNNVMQALKAITESINSRDEETIMNMYNTAKDQLDTNEERTALTNGFLSVLADWGGLQFRAFYYRRKFHKQLKALESL